MDIHSLLRANCEKLVEQYYSNLSAVLALQATFIDEILPDLEDELNLDAESTQWAREWLQDTACLFQILRRHHFTRSFAMESIRKILLWRLNNLRPHLIPPPFSKYHLLPYPDPFGRPIIVLKVSALNEFREDLKDVLMLTMDRLRAHLKQLNDSRSYFGETQPILQYVVLLDLAGLSIQNISVDIISWTFREVIPRFPGMLAAVFMVNYSWTHSGIWTIVRQVLPTSALSRVLFPSHQELLLYFSSSSLPEEYGGALPSLPNLDNPLQPSRDSSPHYSTDRLITSHVFEPAPLMRPAERSTSATSLLNPSFGYPLSASLPSHPLHHGRRRKRDLIRTLARLWWARWGTHVKFYVWVMSLAIGIWLWGRRMRTRGRPFTLREFTSGFP